MIVAKLQVAVHHAFMSTELVTIGKKIKETREAKRLTRKELTGSSELTSTYLANLETDQIREPSLDKIQRIAHSLGTDWQELIKDTNCEQVLLKRQKEASRAWCRNRECPAVQFEVAGEGIGKFQVACEPGSYLHQYGDWYSQVVRVISYPSYPAYNAQGEPNRYCSACGHELVTECHCGRLIDGKHAHCTGCGEFLWDRPQEVASGAPDPEPRL
jgi:transcriptional regulator with XRE-family HTH domain